MKFTDLLQDLGEPIVINPKLSILLNSTNANILLTHLVNCTGKQANEDGWIYKTPEELEDETGLTPSEQKTAREKLKKLGLIEENFNRLIHRMYYRVEFDEVNKLYERS